MAQEKLKKLFVEQFRHLDEKEDQDRVGVLTGADAGGASPAGKNRNEIQLPLGFTDYLKPKYSVDPKL